MHIVFCDIVRVSIYPFFVVAFHSFGDLIRFSVEVPSQKYKQMFFVITITTVVVIFIRLFGLSRSQM